MDFILRALEGRPPGSQEVEVVERKGMGHPDTICDALAEQISVRLCRYYQKRFGVILHHNVDKILLCAGSARPRFGGGEVVAPIEIYLAGRAAVEHRGERIPVSELAIAACRDWLRANLRALDVDAHVRIIPRFRPGSAELIRLFGNQVPLANDTSCGAGFAPLTDLERVVLAVEQALNRAETKRLHPAIGEDIKVMGVRQGARIELTIGCAFIDRFLTCLDDYARAREAAGEVARAAARRVTALAVAVSVNTADDLARGDLFMTVTGTSAEAGDDGEVGRGNRTCGLITPYRPMTLEAAAGKNPVSHVGKLYNLAASRIAGRLAEQLGGTVDVSCVLVSQIGHPIDDPRLVDIRLALEPASHLAKVAAAVQEVVRGELARFPDLRDAVLAGEVRLY